MTMTDFVPRHLRHALVLEDGRLWVPLVDDEDTTFLPEHVQDQLRAEVEAAESKRRQYEEVRWLTAHVSGHTVQALREWLCEVATA